MLRASTPALDARVAASCCRRRGAANVTRFGTAGSGSAVVSGLSNATPNFMPAPPGKSPPPMRKPFQPAEDLRQRVLIVVPIQSRVRSIERRGGADWLDESLASLIEHAGARRGGSEGACAISGAAEQHNHGRDCGSEDACVNVVHVILNAARRPRLLFVHCHLTHC